MGDSRPDPLHTLTAQLARLATNYDVLGAWPQRSIDVLSAAGAWSWIVPREFGGLGLDAALQLRAYEAVGAGCMTTALILTQRDAACEIIAACPDESIRRKWLPPLASGEFLATVGISQLTTSRRSGRPALTAARDGDSWILNGCMPWVTAARQARIVIAGAVTPEGEQLLAIVETGAAGVTIDAPMELMALQASQTCEVHCRNVAVDGRMRVRGPARDVLSSRGPIKPLVVATVGVGLAGTIVRALRQYADRQHSLPSHLVDDFAARHDALRERLFSFADALDRPDAEVPKTAIRVAVNDLLARLAAALLIYSKGSGFLRQFDAQRLAREALFFMVWSSPDDVRAETLAALLDRIPDAPRTMAVD